MERSWNLLGAEMHSDRVETSHHQSDESDDYGVPYEVIGIHDCELRMMGIRWMRVERRGWRRTDFETESDDAVDPDDASLAYPHVETREERSSQRDASPESSRDVTSPVQRRDQ